MYIDSHFHMTYIVARMAGFNQADARVVAYAAQQVDDNFVIINDGALSFSDNSTFSSRWSLLPIPSGWWDLVDIAENAIPGLIHDTWFMFHFVAPCQDGTGSLTDFITTPATDDSGNPTNPTAWKLISYVLGQKGADNALHMLGVALHMFCDTYSHQQFYGMYDQFNRPTVDADKNTIFTVVPPTVPLTADQQASSNSANHINVDVSWLLGWTFGGAIGHAIAIDLPDRPCGSYSWTHLENEVPSGYDLSVARDNMDQWLNCISAMYGILVQYKGGDATITQQQLAAFKQAFENNYELFSSDQYAERAQVWMDYIRTGQSGANADGVTQPEFFAADGTRIFDPADPSSLEPDFVDYVGMQWFIDALNQSVETSNGATREFTVPADAQAYYTGYYTEPNILAQIDMPTKAAFDRDKFNATNFNLFMDSISQISSQMTQFYRTAGITRPTAATLTDRAGNTLAESELISRVSRAVESIAPRRSGNLI